MRKITILFSLVIMFAPSFASAVDYYVSPTGTAAWPDCTDINTPCGGRTAVENAIAGDTVFFRGGTYDPTADPVALWTATTDSLKYETLPWNPQNSGTPGNPITFKAYTGETPVILDNIYSGAFGASGKDYIVWDGFTATIVDTPGGVITLVLFLNTNNCVIRNSNLIGVIKNESKNSALIRPERSQYTLIENNRIHGMFGGVNSAGILNFNSRDMTVRNNDIYDNWLGIWDKDTEQNNQFYNNHIWGQSDSDSCRVGIQTNNQGDMYGSAADVSIYQNVIRNCDVGIFIYNSPALNNNVSIYNNVMFNSSSSADVGIFVSEQSRDAQIYNNLIYGYPIPLRYYSPTGTTVNLSDYNNFYNTSGMAWHIGYSSNYSSLSSWNATTGFDGSSIITDPLFVNAGGIYPDDYMLNSSSPAKGSGSTSNDIGAFPAGTRINIGAIRPRAPQSLQ